MRLVRVRLVADSSLAAVERCRLAGLIAPVAVRCSWRVPRRQLVAGSAGAAADRSRRLLHLDLPLNRGTGRGDARSALGASARSADCGGSRREIRRDCGLASWAVLITARARTARLALPASANGSRMDRLLNKASRAADAAALRRSARRRSLAGSSVERFEVRHRFGNRPPARIRARQDRLFPLHQLLQGIEFVIHGGTPQAPSASPSPCACATTPSLRRSPEPRPASRWLMSSASTRSAVSCNA